MPTAIGSRRDEIYASYYPSLAKVRTIVGDNAAHTKVGGNNCHLFNGLRLSPNGLVALRKYKGGVGACKQFYGIGLITYIVWFNLVILLLS